MTRAVALVAVIAACGGSGGGKPTTPDPSSEISVPPLFAGLFVDGKLFAYKVETKTTQWDDMNPKADADGNVTEVTTESFTCRTRGMQNFSEAVAVKLECDAHVDTDISPAGVYVATATGIWRLDAFPLDDAEIAKLDPNAMLMPAVPAPSDQRTEDPDGGGGQAVIVEQKDGGRWCQTRSYWGGDEAGTTICFAPKIGLVGGGAFFAGGSTRDITYELTAPEM